MQKAGKSQVSFTAEQDHVLVWCSEALELQIISEPEPAEHLDYHWWTQQEPEQQTEPDEIPMAEKLLREPQIRAHIKHIGSHTYHWEAEVQARVSGEHRGDHGEELPLYSATFFYCTLTLGVSRNV